MVLDEKPYNSLNVSANTILVDDLMSFPTALNLGEILGSAKLFYPNWDDGLAAKLFDYFSFHHKQRHNQLSKGMKSTFNMIVGIASRCQITIFDEPTTGMDAAVRKDFYRALLKDYIAHPRTIILSSHHLEEIENLVEDILLIRNGEKHLHVTSSYLKEFAIGVKGKKDALLDWLEDKEVLYKRPIGSDSLYVVIENMFSGKYQQDMKRLGFEWSAVSSSDICVYLTGSTEGGIDDVFN
jgi:ABC-2 type transport system ATP-binding protein